MDLFSLEKRRQRVGFIEVSNFLVIGRREAGTGFALVTSERTQGNGLKLSSETFRLDIMKLFFLQRVLGHWNRLPSTVVIAPSLTNFKMHWDSSLRHMV